MADLDDVLSSLRALVSSALYPPASYPSGPTGNSVAGLPVLVQSGWPDANSLEKQLAANGAQVTVYPLQTERNTTRFPQSVSQFGALQPATFTLQSSGYTVTVGGAQPSPTFYPQNICVFVNRVPFIYTTTAPDTPSAIATALAAKIAVSVPGTSASGSVVTVPSPAIIGALRIGTSASTAQHLKQQEREFQLVIWAPSTAARGAIARVVDPVIPQNKFLTFADGTKGKLTYRGSPYTDFDQKMGAYRRDICVTVEYSTVAISTAPEVVAFKTIYDQMNPITGAEEEPPIATTYT